MEIILLLLFGFGAVFAIIFISSLVFGLIKFTAISVSKGLQLVLITTAIILLTIFASVFLFEPFYSKIFEQTVSGDDARSNFIYLGVAIAIIVLLFGKSLPFKIYGLLSIAINTISVVSISLLMYETNSNLTSVNTATYSSINSLSIFSIYLTSINLVTFFLYGYDKFRAWIFPKPTISNGFGYPPSVNHWSQKLAGWFAKHIPWIKPPRVPEWILHWHLIFGGTIGAIFGQRFFNHKTKSKKFQPVFCKVIAIQVILSIVIFAINVRF